MNENTKDLQPANLGSAQPAPESEPAAPASALLPPVEARPATGMLLPVEATPASAVRPPVAASDPAAVLGFYERAKARMAVRLSDDRLGIAADPSEDNE